MKQDATVPGVDLLVYEKLKAEGMSPVDVFAYAWRADCGPLICIKLMMVIFGFSMGESLDILGETHQKYPDLKPYEGEFYS
jgi:hypothetical protein